MDPTTSTTVAPSRSKTWIIVILIGVALLCCIAVLSIVFISQLGSGTPKTDNPDGTDSGSTTNGSSPSSSQWGGTVDVGLKADNFNQTQFNVGTIARTSRNPSPFTRFSSPVKPTPVSLAANPPENKISYVVLNEVLLSRAAFKALAQSGWGKDGNTSSSSIRLTASQLGYSPAQLAEMARVEKIKEQEQNIPKDLQPLYTSDQAGAEIQAMVLKAYEEYYQYLQAKGVNTVYIEQMKTIVPLNKDRVRYIYKGEEAEYASSVHANEEGTGAVDYSVRYMDITAGSLFNDMKYFFNSRILGPLPTAPAERYQYHKSLRELIVRRNVYHESTHVLQRAYLQAHAPASSRSEKTIHLSSTKNLATLDSANAWKWSKVSGINHEEVTRTQESQCDGIAFDVLTNVYSMNDAQKNALWTHIYGRLDPSVDALLEIKQLWADNWPDMVNKSGYPSSIAGIVFSGSDETSTALRKAMRRIDMAAYAGYLDPLRPEETDNFWNTVKIYEPETNAPVEPVSTPAAEPAKSGRSGCLWIAIIVIVLFGCVAVAAVGVWLLAQQGNKSDTPGTSSGPTATPGFTNNPTTPVNLGLPSLRRESISTKPSRQTQLSEVELVVESLKLLQQRNWNGSNRDEKLQASDFPQSTWDRWKATQEQRRAGLTIPDSVLDLYTSPQAQTEIKAEAMKIRQEYLDFIKARGVNQRYIDEINQRVLPTDSSRYLFHFENNLESAPTSVEGISVGRDKDFMKLQMHLSVIDFNNGARVFRESGILGTPQETPHSDQALEKQLRALGMRWYIYHEMTHVLQRAYINIHADPKYANSLEPYDDPRKTTMIAADTYFWKWGQKDPWDAAAQNYDIASESQAEGISFEALTTGYDLSVAQKNAAWEHMFGRLKTVQGQLNQARSTFESKYPDYFPHDFDNYLSNTLEPGAGANADLVFSLTLRLGIMSSYVGYSNPMLPQDTGKFWAIFK